MIGIAEALPSTRPETADRLERALAGTGLRHDAGEQAALIAKRDALLALAA